MVGAGHPQGSVALHPLGADEDILHSVIQCMAHVQLTGHVRRRHHDGVGFLVGVCFRVEVAAVQPELVDAVFHLAGVVLFCEFFHRGSSQTVDDVGRKKPPHGTFHGTAVSQLHRGTTQIAQKAPCIFVPLDAPITWDRPGGDY